MCGDPQPQTTVVNQQQQPTPTPEQTAMIQLQLQQMQQTMPGQTQAQLTGLSLVNQMLAGGTSLPGYFGQVGAGIGALPQLTPGTIAPAQQMTEGQISPEAIAAQAGVLTQQLLPQYQQLGLSNSGTMQADIQKQLVNQLLFPAEVQNIANQQYAQQFNIGTEQQTQAANISNFLTAGQYNIGQEYSRQGYNLANISNLLGLGLTGQYQVQQPIQTGIGQLGAQLSGLQGLNTSQQSMYYPATNPFLGGLKGAVSGAQAGSMFGPWGTVIGGLGGAGLGVWGQGGF